MNEASPGNIMPFNLEKITVGNVQKGDNEFSGQPKGCLA